MVSRADLVVAATPPLLSSWCAADAARKAGVPFCLLVYDVVADLATEVFPIAGKLAALPARRLEGGLLARADAVVTLTDEMARRIGEASGRVAPITVIPIWADDELLAEEPHDAADECRAELAIEGHRSLIGFAGSFARKQHLPEIVEAAGGIGDDVTVVFVGEGLERRRMEERARRSAGDVRVLTQRSGRELHGFLAACDLSIVPALTRHGGTGFPSKVANTLAAGCPILAISAHETELTRLLRGEDLGLACDLGADSIRDSTRRALALGSAADRRRRCRAYASTHWRRSDAMARFGALVNRLVS
jgi:glycosyltransferase involved in cell wall biosynthesis